MLITPDVINKGEPPEIVYNKDRKPVVSGIYERVCENREGGMSHKVYFIFLCRLEGERALAPTGQDNFQVGTEWVDANELRHRNLFPRAIRDNLPALTGYGETIYIGSERER